VLWQQGTLSTAERPGRSQKIMNAYATASLYVGDLHSEVTEALLFELFNAVGPVASIRVCRDSVSRRSLGYAYVNFHSVVDAERALETMNYTLIKNKPCRIMWCHRDPSLRKSGTGNVFIKSLDKSIDNKALYDTFSAFGNILSCKVATDDQGASKGYGALPQAPCHLRLHPLSVADCISPDPFPFSLPTRLPSFIVAGFVHYETQEAANLAVTKVNGMLLNGKKVFVGFFVPRKDRSGGSEANDSFTNVYVKNLAPDVEDEKLDELFKAHGPIKSAIVMKDGEGKSRGFGFVNFEEHEHAAQACEALNNTEVNGKAMFVGRAQKKRDRERELRDKFEALKVERANKFTGVNLFVKNLDDNVDDEKLREAFTPFGTISSAKVMSDEKGTSKGFGFVCFDSQEEATKAVSEMNGHILANKPLYVALAQRKEERKNILEQQHQTRSSNGMGRMQRGPDGGMPGQAVAYPGAPFFYSPQQMPQQRGGPGFMYPQQMMMRPAPGAYQQMGQYGGAMAMGNRAGGGRMQQGGRGPQGAGNLRGPNKQGGQMQQRQGFPQRPGGPPPGQPGAPQGQPGAPMGQPGAPMPGGPMGQPPQMAPQEINAATLAAAPPEQQKQLLGERLFPLIQNVEPHLAGKITGMLLEMDNGELLNLLESPDALNAKIMEALSVLQMHSDNVPKEGMADGIPA
jgi:polyadenylate-binding protein